MTPRLWSLCCAISLMMSPFAHLHTSTLSTTFHPSFQPFSFRIRLLGEMQEAHEHKFISTIYWNVFMGEVITASSWVNSNSICKGWQMSGELSVGTQCGGEYLNIQTIIFMGLAWGPGLEGAREERSINIDSTLYLTRTVRSLTNTFNSAPN